MASLIISFDTNGAQSYRISYKTTGVVPVTYITPEATSSPVTITNVDATKSYNITVEANCGNGLYSSIVNATATATQCATVTNVSAQIS